MTNRTRRLLIAAPWLSLPLLLGSYFLFWDRLPAAIALKFDASGNPADTMRKGAALALQAAVLLFILLQYSLRLRDGEKSAPTSVFVVYYVAVAFVTIVFGLVLLSNL